MLLFSPVLNCFSYSTQYSTVKVYVDPSPSFSTIKKWAAEFKRGCTSLEDDPCEGRPKSATTLFFFFNEPVIDYRMHRSLRLIVLP
jgi:hypothetical protein